MQDYEVGIAQGVIAERSAILDMFGTLWSCTAAPGDFEKPKGMCAGINVLQRMIERGEQSATNSERIAQHNREQQALGIERAAQELASMGAEDGDSDNLRAFAERVRNGGVESSEVPDAYTRGREAERSAIIELLWEKAERAKNDNPHAAHMCMVLREEIVQGLHVDG